ncbi:MAG: hypothetical protein ACYCWW_18745 [Deltaproteobacteria bacterium]
MQDQPVTTVQPGFSAVEIARFLGVSVLAVAMLCVGFPAGARADTTTQGQPLLAQNYPPPPAYPPSSPPPAAYPPPAYGAPAPGYGAQAPMGQMQDVGTAVQDGKNDADTQISGALWFGAGCLLTWVGIILGYVLTPTPDGSRMIGKSPSYVAAYTDAYQNEGKSFQGIHAVYGCITAAVFYILFYVVYFVIIVGAATGVAAAGL